MLTKTLLHTLANPTSYSRGEDYFYNHHVRRIKRSGNTFTGKVEGSELYDVSLTIGGIEPDFTCSCPYDQDGICKHSVALGLAVIDEFGPVIELVDTATKETLTIDPNILWSKTTTDQKLTFLRQLLEKQVDIRAQFAQFSEMAGAIPKLTFFSPSDNKDKVSIESISEDVFDALSDLSFDEDWLQEDQDDYYSEDLPDPGPLIEEVLTDYADEVIVAFREGRLLDAMTTYLGVYEGTLAATKPDNDEFDIIDDYPSQTWEVWLELLVDAHNQLASRVLHPDQIGQTLSRLAGRVAFFDKQGNDEGEDDDDDDDFYDERGPTYYNLKSFEPLLLALVTDMPSARVVQHAIEQYNWQNRNTEYIQLRIADVLQSPDLWLQIANQFADHDAAIALQLLQRQRQTGDMAVVIQTLHRLSKPFPKTFDDFILETLDDKALAPGPDLNLYLKALENRCRSAGQLPDYLKLRTYWTQAQRQTFADSLRPLYVIIPLFYAQVLDTEGRSDELFTWVESLTWQYSRSLPEILLLAAKTHPDQCLDLMKTRATSLLENGKRDRSLYHTIAGWLAALHSIPSLKQPVALFANQLVANYSRLSALRDELRMQGLVRR